MERNHQIISFVLFRTWRGTIHSGLSQNGISHDIPKQAFAYYSNSMATQALLLSSDVVKHPGPSQERVASTNNLSGSRPTAAKCDHCQKTIRWSQKNISCANCMECACLKCVYLIVRAHRVSRVASGPRRRPRIIVCKLRDFKQKEQILKVTRRIKPVGLYVNEDLAKETLDKREEQRPKLEEAKRNGKIAYFVLDKLIVKDRRG